MYTKKAKYCTVEAGKGIEGKLLKSNCNFWHRTNYGHRKKIKETIRNG
jgi:hypothetical protein